MRQKINNMIAIMLAIIILCASSYAVVSYAADTYKSAAELESQGASTNDKNVEVDVYYAGGEHSKTVDITETEKIYAKVAVKNAGYLENLTINFANSNFEIANDESNAGKIQSIDTKNKVVVLNKIVAGNEVEIALNISPIKTDVVGTDNFKRDNTITVSGTYVNEKAKEVVISKEIAIHTSWHGEAKTKINQEIVKYIPSVLGEEVLLQTEVTTEVENSVLPVKNSEVMVDIPELAETKPIKVMVYAKTTEGTNGEKTAISFNEANYSYDETNGELIINVANNANSEGKISWVKNVQDKYEIVMVYQKEAIAALKESTSIIQTSASITNEYYNDVDYSDGAEITEQTPLSQKGTIADYEGGIENESIAKGYMYNGVETTYTEKYCMSMSYAEVTDEMSLTVNTSEFIKESGETVSSGNNIYNKKVSVDIAELKKILGETGKVEIISNSKVVGTIDANTEVDSNGKATVDISAEKASSIEVKTSKPQTQGQLSVEIEKAIASDMSYSLAERKSFTGVKQVATGTAKAGEEQITTAEVTDTMNLVEPTQKISISANKQNLLIAGTNEMELTALLETDSADDSLYENPIITITFPKEIENIDVRGIELVHSEELNLNKYQLLEDENAKYLQIEMSGTQTKYNDGLIKGTSVIAKVSFNVNEQAEAKKTAISIKPASYLEDVSINSEIEINFIKAPEVEKPANEETTNNDENGNNNSNTNSSDNNIEQTEQSGLVIVSKAIVGNNELKDGEEVFEGTGIKYEVTVKNNTGADIQNLKLIATNTNVNYYDLETIRGTYQNDQGGMDENDYTKYNELTDWTQKEFETIESLANGATKTFTYKVVVKEVEGEAETIEKLKISADGINEVETELMKNPIKQGEVKVKTQFNIVEEEPLISGVYTPVILTVTNISDSEIEDAYVNCKFSDGIGIRSSGLYIKDTEDEELGYELVEIKEDGLKLKLDKLSKEEERQIILYVDLLEKEETATESIITYVETTEGNIYTANTAERIIYQINTDLEYSMSCNVEENSKVTTGDKITYYINIKNNEEEKQVYMMVQDKMPAGAIVSSIKTIKNGEITDKTEEALKVSSYAYMLLNISLKAKESIQIEIECTVDAGLASDNKISNYASIELNGETLDTNTITHVTYNEGDPDSEDPDPDNPDPDNPDPDNPDPDNPDPDNPDPDNPDPDNPAPDNPNTDDQNPEEKYYTVSGKAWFDQNRNSAKDPKEYGLKDINVIIIKAETGEYLFTKDGEKITTKTDKKGEYKLENIPKGKYLILFEYDSEQYEPVEYKKQGISDFDNSSVIKKQAIIDGNTKEIAVTDILDVDEENIQNVNIGLKLKDRFDLSLDKYVSKVIVQNGAGTSTHQYSNTQLAKLEIPAKYYKNSKLIIEYTITIKNEGNVGGYAKDIVDYIPAELKFSSELNTDWYLGKDNYLHNITLENTMIDVGETKEIKLILTRTIPDESAETIINTAEIGASSNEYSLEDIDSTPGNKVQGEDDMSTAKTIISIKTGETVKIILLTIALTLAISAVVVIIMRRRG